VSGLPRHAPRRRVRNYHREVALSQTHGDDRGVEGRSTRVRKSREARRRERKGTDDGGGGGGRGGGRGRRKRECFYCSTSRLKVAFPGQWADPLKPPRFRGR